MWYFDAIDNDDDYYFTARIYYGNPNNFDYIIRTDQSTMQIMIIEKKNSKQKNPKA